MRSELSGPSFVTLEKVIFLKGPFIPFHKGVTYTFQL